MIDQERWFSPSEKRELIRRGAHEVEKGDARCMSPVERWKLYVRDYLEQGEAVIR